MAKTYVLDRVAADLARGHTHPAIQRLGSLVAAHPTDLDLRHRLAMAHRRVGNRIQAGRWDYLTAGASAGETSAFERAFPSALARLREIRWPHRASVAATEYARTRLAALLRAAETERVVPRTRSSAGTPGGAVRVAGGSWWPLRRTRSWWSGRPGRAALVAAGAAATITLAAVGVATVLQWIV